MEIGDWSGKIGDWSLGARRFFDLRRGVADRRRVRRLSNFAPKDWHEATDVCAAEGKVLCGVDKPCSRSGCGYDLNMGQTISLDDHYYGIAHSFPSASQSWRVWR